MEDWGLKRLLTEVEEERQYWKSRAYQAEHRAEQQADRLHRVQRYQREQREQREQQAERVQAQDFSSKQSQFSTIQSQQLLSTYFEFIGLYCYSYLTGYRAAIEALQSISSTGCKQSMNPLSPYTVGLSLAAMSSNSSDSSSGHRATPTVSTPDVSAGTTTQPTTQPVQESQLIQRVPMFVTPMPAPGTPGAPHFDGTNISDFLELWQDVCIDHGYTEEEGVRRISRYCSPIIRLSVEALDDWINRKWEPLKATLLKEYISQDVKQQALSRQYLEQYKEATTDGKDNLKAYISQFSGIANTLIGKRALDSYTATDWFLKGIPQGARQKIIKKAHLDFYRPETYNFEKVVKEAKRYQEDQESAKMFEASKGKQEFMQILVDQRSSSPPQEINKPVMAKAPVMTNPTDEKLDALTKQFETLALPLQMLAGRGGQQRPMNPPPVNQQPMYPRQQNYQSSYRPMPVHETRVPPPQPRPYPQEAYANADMRPQFGSRPIQGDCHYCHEPGHIRRICPYMLKMIDAGKIHLNGMGRICRGPEGQGGEEMYLPYGMSQKDAVITLLDGYEPKQSQAPSRANPAPKAQSSEFATASFRLADDGSTDEEEDDFEFEFIANAAQPGGSQPRGRGRPITNPKLDKARRVTKNRADQDTNLPGPKNIRPGGWRQPPGEVPGDDSDGTADGDVDMDDLLGEPVFGPQPRPTTEKRVGFVEPEPTTEDHETGGRRLANAAPRRKNIKLADVLKKQGEDNPVVTEKMLKAVIPDITVGDILSSGMGTHKMMFKPLKQEVMDKLGVGKRLVVAGQHAKVTRAGAGGGMIHQVTARLTNTLYSSACPQVPVEIGDIKTMALLDSGAEVNLIEASVLSQAGVPYLADSNLTLVDVNGKHTSMLGMVENVEITIGTFTYTQSLMVVEKASSAVILGMPFFVGSRMKTEIVNDGSTRVSIVCPSTGEEIRFTGVASNHKKNKYLNQLQDLRSSNRSQALNYQ